MTTHAPSLRLLIGLLALACLAPPAFAQWKWRDASGRITVSDLPPPRGVADRDILQRPTQPVPRAAEAPASAAALVVPAAKPSVDPELQARKKAADQAQAAKDKAEAQREAELRQENCRYARGHLATLDSGQRMARVNEKGEREILDEKQRAAEAERARSVIASDCR